MTQAYWAKRLTICDIPAASADRLRDDPKPAAGVALPWPNWQSAIVQQRFLTS
jgi:hypothetical protein